MSITAIATPASAAPAPFVLSSPDLSPDTATIAASTPSPNTQKIDAVATDFEAVFLSQMMSEMFSGDDITGFFGGGTAGEVYKSYLLNEYGKLMAKAGGIGIATQVKQELLKLQEIGS